MRVSLTRAIVIIPVGGAHRESVQQVPDCRRTSPPTPSLLLPPPGRAGPSGASPKRAPSPSLFGPDPADGGVQGGPRRRWFAMLVQATPGTLDSRSRARPCSFAASLDHERTPKARDVGKKSRVLIYGDDVINKGEVCVQVVSYGRATT